MDEVLKARLGQPTSLALVKHRAGKGGLTFKYLKGSDVRKLLNDVFEYEWNHEVISLQDIGGSVIAHVRILVRLPDGTILSHDGIGKGIVRGDNKADAFLGAETNAIKRAAINFGVGLDLYDDEEDQDQSGIKSAPPPMPPAPHSLPNIPPIPRADGLDMRAPAPVNPPNIPPPIDLVGGDPMRDGSNLRWPTPPLPPVTNIEIEGPGDDFARNDLAAQSNNQQWAPPLVPPTSPPQRPQPVTAPRPPNMPVIPPIPRVTPQAPPQVQQPTYTPPPIPPIPRGEPIQPLRPPQPVTPRVDATPPFPPPPQVGRITSVQEMALSTIMRSKGFASEIQLIKSGLPSSTAPQFNNLTNAEAKELLGWALSLPDGAAAGNTVGRL